MRDNFVIQETISRMILRNQELMHVLNDPLSSPPPSHYMNGLSMNEFTYKEGVKTLKGYY
jgi:hypothetical protein